MIMDMDPLIEFLEDKDHGLRIDEYRVLFYCNLSGGKRSTQLNKRGNKNKGGGGKKKEIGKQREKKYLDFIFKEWPFCSNVQISKILVDVNLYISYLYKFLKHFAIFNKVEKVFLIPLINEPFSSFPSSVTSPFHFK
uniref:Uncharacterized protein n=1 Tax=Timema cristinae TaxID=61476 RepID=A0A7R9D8U2_TIMCR|nr:unnamed protein product [Timema cristinae]